MNKRRIAAVAAAVGTMAALAVSAVAAPPAQPGPGAEAGPPAVIDPSVPSMPRQLGVGERLLLVVGGAYGSQREAVAAAEAMHFGELQGFYAVPVSQFSGLRAAVGGSADWALVSAFRTREGAEEFADLARMAGARPVITPRVVSLPGAYAGLGQERAPSGTGPLAVPVPESMPEGTGA